MYDVRLTHALFPAQAGTAYRATTFGELLAGQAAALGDRLAMRELPAHWIWVDEWPLTGAGKIQKFVLRDRFVKGEYQATTVVGM